MIRNATAADLPQLAAALVRLQEAHVRAFPALFRSFDDSAALAHLSGLLSREDAWVRVADDQGVVAGHAVFLIETKRESLFTPAQRFGHLAQIEVEPAYRRKGYGRLLLADCERLAAEQCVGAIVLDVWAFNQTAKAFFQSRGYSEFGARLSREIL